MHLWRNTEVRACNHCCHAKVISITYSECAFVALGIKHAISISHIIICGVPGSTIYFYDIQTARFSKKKLLNIKCVRVLILSTTFVRNTRRSKRDMIKNVSSSSCKIPLFFSDFNETFQDIFKNAQTSNFMKTRPLFHANWRTDR